MESHVWNDNYTRFLITILLITKLKNYEQESFYAFSGDSACCRSCIYCCLCKRSYYSSPYSATFKLNLADGVKFYLKGEAGKYFTAEEKTIDKQTVWTLGTTTESIADASVFEVRNFAKVSGGATFELYADGKKLVVSNCSK